MLKGKHVLLGVTGGIAAYKACELASALVRQHADVNVIMTEHATRFVQPLTFDALTMEFHKIEGGRGHHRAGDSQRDRKICERSRG